MSEDEEDTCPCCGQGYDHKRTETIGVEPDYRDDAVVCRTAAMGGQRTAYIHIGGR